MSLIGEEEILAGIQHDDFFVRSGMLEYVSKSKAGSTAAVSALALDMLERHGLVGAFQNIHNLHDLPLDRDSARRLVDIIERAHISDEASGRAKQLGLGAAASWLLVAPLAESAELSARLSQIDSLADTDVVEDLQAQAQIAELDADTCMANILRLIETTREPESDLEEAEEHALFSWCERLAAIDGSIDRDLLSDWLAMPVQLDDDQWSKDTIRLWVGLILAQHQPMPIPFEKWLEILGAEVDRLEDALGRALARQAEPADLLQLLERYAELSDLSSLIIAEILEQHLIPELEAPLIAAIKDDQLEHHARLLLGPAVAYHATEDSLAAAEQLCLQHGQEDLLDVELILYAFYRVLGIDKPELTETWQKKFQEIQDMTQSLLDDPDSILSMLGDPDAAYDPLVAPDPEEWLDMDDGEKQYLISSALHDYEAGIGEGFEAHCIMHLIVENQVALNEADTPTGEQMDRLMSAGLNRHEAIHALGNVIMCQMWEMQTKRKEMTPVSLAKEMRSLKSKDWVGSAPYRPSEEAGDGDADGDTYGAGDLDFFDEPDYPPSTVQTVRNEEPKIGRNDPCPCGSEKKYKKCCVASL